MMVRDVALLPDALARLAQLVSKFASYFLGLISFSLPQIARFQRKEGKAYAVDGLLRAARAKSERHGVGTVGTASATKDSIWRQGYDAMSRGNWLERVGAGFGAFAGSLIAPFTSEDEYGNTHNPVTGEPVWAADAKNQRLATTGAVILAPIQVMAQTTRTVAQESARQIISRIAQGHASRGTDYMRGFMTPRELRAFSGNPAAGSRFLGQVVHRETAETLREQFPGRFEYFRKRSGFS